MQQLDKLTSKIYSSICFKEGKKPALDKLKDIFIKEGRLINNNPKNPVIMTVEQYITIFNTQIEQGIIKEFFEEEIAHRTEVFGKLAHRFSTYKTIFRMHGVEVRNIGINAIQFVRIDNKWLISGMTWNDETDGMHVPAKYLPDEIYTEEKKKRKFFRR